MENHLLDLIKSQPYLAANILYLIWLVIGLFLVVPLKQRMIVIVSGLISIPCFPFLVLFENNYWVQNRLGGWVLGIEDAICSFAVAAMVWLVISALFRNRISSKISMRGAFNRYISSAGISVFIFLILFSVEFLPMTALVLCNLIVWVMLIFLRRDLLLFSLSGMLAYGFVHFLLMKSCFLFIPDFILTWNAGNIWGTPVIGVPLGEIAWAMIYGAFWSLFMAHSLGIRLNCEFSQTT
ncbi:MAG: hypothetical protein EHM85_00065 [Desulfobacteraceae bacterium]|nr:MAG: hypothetical protein EHM85_00065 [Desulfobacteraceae bacterium]